MPHAIEDEITSGQHPPLYDQLQPFEFFPESISGPTVWHADEYAKKPEAWTHTFTPEEISELSDAADNFLTSGTQLIKITKVGLKARFINCLL
jgi:hypothetical protein